MHFPKWDLPPAAGPFLGRVQSPPRPPRPREIGMRGHVQSGAILLDAAEQALALWLVLQFPSCCEIYACILAKVLSQTFRLMIILSPNAPCLSRNTRHTADRKASCWDLTRRPRDAPGSMCTLPQALQSHPSHEQVLSSGGADLEALWDRLCPSGLSAPHQESLDCSTSTLHLLYFLDPACGSAQSYALTSLQSLIHLLCPPGHASALETSLAHQAVSIAPSDDTHLRSDPLLGTLHPRHSEPLGNSA